MKEKPNFTVYAKYYFTPHCPYCGVAWNETVFNDVEKMTDEIWEYMTYSYRWSCLSCKESGKK